MKGFAKFINLQESILSQREINKIGMKEIDRFVFDGWEIFIWNKQKQSPNPIYVFSDWLNKKYEDENFNLEELISNSLDRVLTEEDREDFEIFKNISLLSEEGWSSYVLDPNEKTKEIMGELYSSFKYSMDEDEEKAMNEILVSAYLKGAFSSYKVFMNLENNKQSEENVLKGIQNRIENYIKTVWRRCGINSDDVNYIWNFLLNNGGNTDEMKPRYLYGIIPGGMKKILNIQEEDGMEALIRFILATAKKIAISYLRHLKNVLDAIFSFNFSVFLRNSQRLFESSFALIIQESRVCCFNDIAQSINLNNSQIYSMDFWSAKDKVMSSNSLNDILFEYLYNLLNRIMDDHPPLDEREYDKYKKKVIECVRKVITALISMNIRSFHRVPIIFCYQNWQEPLAYGGFKAGEAWNNKIFIYGNQDEKNLISTLSHEIGHIVFSRLSYEDQEYIKSIATEGPAVRDYGKVNYIYQNLQSPTIGHKSGNEWFATMIEYLATHPRAKLGEPLPNNRSYNLPDDQKDIFNNRFTTVRKIVAGSQNYGQGYKNQPTYNREVKLPRRLKRRKDNKGQF